MHSAAQVFRRAMAIGAAKSVSFEEKNSVRFEINLQKVLKLKKIPPLVPCKNQRSQPPDWANKGSKKEQDDVQCATKASNGPLHTSIFV